MTTRSRRDGVPGTRRGRPPDPPAAIERRRQDIVEAAYAVFAEKGYHGAGVTDIAARLDIGHGTFYRYFANKRDVLDHVVDYGAGRFRQLVAPVDLPEATSIEQLHAQLVSTGARLFAVVAHDKAPLARMLLFEATAIDEELTQRVLGLLESFTASCAGVLGNGVRRGFLRADLDVGSAARALVGAAISGLFTHLRRPMDEFERARYIDAVVSLVCDNRAPSATAANRSAS